MMQAFYQTELYPEAGCDEAGRGCLAGPVVAAAVVFPKDYWNDAINDSKQLSEKQRVKLRDEIIRDAVSYGIGMCDNQEIDNINILQASLLAMHRALDALTVSPEFIIIDGNKWKDYHQTPFQTVVKGDAKFLSIAAASILAKTYRDEWMVHAAAEYPLYNWEKNKGYPTKDHRLAIIEHGVCPLHRLSYEPCQPRLSL
ncbi:MAG: ribonuclease HII [Bacteroidales bacterium]|nr:ribonuclease HII [Bacteroidales bacterium]